jgi:hypothetical protein
MTKQQDKPDEQGDALTPEAREIAEIASADNKGMSPSLWAWYFGVEHVERNTGPDYPVLSKSEKYAVRTVVEGQIMRTFEAYAHTLPLRQYPSGLLWPKAEPLPQRWREGHFMTKAELREWAKEHAPDLLGSALLAEPKSAPAGEAVTESAPLKMGNSTKGKRAQPLTAEIEAAKLEATNPEDYMAVFAVLQRHAEQRIVPFLGFVEGEGCKYQTPNGIEIFTQEALRKRMKRAR